MFSKEGFFDSGSVGDDGDGLQFEVLLAVVEEGAEEGWVQEGFATGEVDLLHASGGKEGESAFGVGEVAFVGGCSRVEAEAATVVALAAKVIVDGNWALDRLGFGRKEGAGQEIGDEGDRKGEDD